MNKVLSIDETTVSQACFNMVEGQLKPGGVRDLRLTHMMKQVPRENFVTAAQCDLAYADCELDCRLGEAGRRLMSPLAFARLVELADIQPEDVVLDIAGGTGYSAAVLAGLANTVIGLEADIEMSQKADQNWQDLNITNAVAVTGPLSEGQAKQGPFHVIFINGCVAQIPDGLLQQLDEGGRLVCVAPSEGVSRAHCYTRQGDGFFKRVSFDVSVPDLTDFEPARVFEF